MDHSLDRRRSAIDWLVDSFAFLGSLLLGSIVFDQNNDLAPSWLQTLDLASGTLLCVLLWFRRRWPVPLALLGTAMSTYSEMAGIASLVLLLTVAIHCRFRSTVLVAGANLLSLTAYAFVRKQYDPLPAVLSVAVLLTVGTIGWGLYVRSRRQLVQTLQDRADRAEILARLQAEQGQLRAREEIAREMHDVLGHRLSLLSVHAGALAYRPDASTAEVAGAAEVIRSSAHQALQDLREVIGVLRAPVGELPQPAFEDLPLLVDGARQAGLEVELRYDVPGRLPQHIGRTAYRIVQEGLTNAMKHAPGAPVRIEVSGAQGNGLTIEVSNPLPSRSLPGSGSGRGLTGLTERAALVEGRLRHGHAGSDFRLSAWLPWAS